MATMLNPNAIPDGSITQKKIDASVLDAKQDKLTAGNGIQIEENEIGVTSITESETQPNTSLWVNPSENTEVELTYNRSQIDSLVSSKQDTISDLGTIRKGAALGRTSLQEHQDISHLATIEEVENKLATKQGILTDNDGGYGQRIYTLERDGATKTYVNNAIASAIITALNTEI